MSGDSESRKCLGRDVMCDSAGIHRQIPGWNINPVVLDIVMPLRKLSSFGVRIRMRLPLAGSSPSGERA